MATDEKSSTEELISLSIQAGMFEDTLMLIINKHASRPLTRDRLLEELNRHLKRHGKQTWDEGDIEISIGLLTKNGFIENPGK